MLNITVISQLKIRDYEQRSYIVVNEASQSELPVSCRGTSLQHVEWTHTGIVYVCAQLKR